MLFRSMNNHVHSAPPEWQEHSRLKNLQQTVLKKFGKKFVKQPQWLRKYMSPKSSRGLKIFLHVSVYLHVHSWLLRGEAELPWSPSPRSGPHTWEEDDPQLYMYTHYSSFPSVAERIGHTTCTCPTASSYVTPTHIGIAGCSASFEIYYFHFHYGSNLISSGIQGACQMLSISQDNMI